MESKARRRSSLLDKISHAAEKRRSTARTGSTASPPAIEHREDIAELHEEEQREKMPVRNESAPNSPPERQQYHHKHLTQLPPLPPRLPRPRGRIRHWIRPS